MEKMIRFGTFNIWNSQNRGLELALFTMAQVRVYYGVFQEKKLTKAVHMREASVFQVISTEVPSTHRGSVAIFYHKADHFVIKELRLHGMNVIKFPLVTGRRRWHIAGFYMSPRYVSTI